MDTKTSQAEEMRQLMRSLNRRMHSGRRQRLKVLAWKATIYFSIRLKRYFDIVVSLLALVVLFPLMLVVVILIKLESRGPIIFQQVRVGQYGRHFKFFKFRSMYNDTDRRKAELLSLNQSADGVIFKMKRDPRVTRVGRVIRKFSIDELPQLFNVLNGDMSLVGPRPPLPSEVREYTLEDRKRLNVLPGITCIWQTSGRSDIPFKQQVELDKEYIVNHGFWRDVWILLKTIPAVFIGRGAY